MVKLVGPVLVRLTKCSFLADGTGSSRTLLESIDLGVVSEEDGKLAHSTMALVPSKTRREKGTAATHGLTENFITISQARLRCGRAATETAKER